MRSAQGDWINRTEHLCIGIPDNSGQSPPIYIVLQHPFPQETEILYNSPASPCLLRCYIWTSFWIFLWCCLLQQQKYIAFLLLVFAHRVITSENASSKNFSSWLQNLTLCSVSCRSPEKTEDKLSLESHQVLSRTNRKILVSSQKDQKIYTGEGDPIGWSNSLICCRPTESLHRAQMLKQLYQLISNV